MAAPRPAPRRRAAPGLGKAYEKALLEAQREASPDGILVVGPDGRILSHNQRFLELWRIPAKIIAAKDDDKALASVLDRVRDPQAFMARVRQIYSRPDESSFDVLAMRDGRTLERHSAPVLGPKRRRLGRVWYFRDVTERLSADKALWSSAEELRRSHERFDLAVRGSRDGIWDWDIVADKVYFSPRWKEMLGYSDAELENSFQTWVTLIHPEDRERALAAVRDYHDGKIAVYELEHRLRHKDGSWRWILSRGAVLRDAAGRPLRMSGSHADITDRRRVESALRESESRFRQVVDNIRDAFWLVGARDSSVLYVNSAWEQIWGRPLPPLDRLAEVWLEAMHPDDRERVLAAGARRAEGPYETVYRITRPDGQIRWVRDRGFPVVDAGGKVERVAGFSEDVTESRRLEQELLAARDAALASARAKSEFLANVSHELRTPLHAVNAMCELMARERLPEPHAERARLAHDAVRLLGSIIDDILDFSKLEAGRMELESVEMSPRRVLEDSVAMFREDAAAKGLELALDCGPGLPDSAYADPLRLRQILNNLVGNAIKFTERGSVRVRADAEPLQGGWELRVEVADTGIGLAPGARERLFQAFSQADATTTRRYGGTGLGLAISRQLVEMMGGAIAADGEPGQGSRFVFRVRLSAACALPERRTSARAAPAPDLAGRRVLVVEDNPVNRKVAADQLAQFGCAVELAEDGRKALEAFARAPFDLVLMDCQMPVMDGYAAAAELRRREPPGERVPIVAMTAGGSSAEIERCRESGMDDCLIKPVGLEALAEALGRWAAPVDASALAAAAQTLSAASASWREDYLSDAKRLLDQAAAALARGRRDELRRAAHTLKGSSAALGARRLGRLAAALEAAESPSAAAIDEARAELARVERAVS